LLIVDEVEGNTTELDAAMFVVLVVEMAVTRKNRIISVLCFEAVNILHPAEA
jgi:hypothetical protein